MGKKAKKKAKEQKSKAASRGYTGAVYNRLTSWRPTSTSQDAETRVALRSLRNNSRDLVRNDDYAKAAVRLIVGNVIGRGVSMQSQIMQKRGTKADKKLNLLVEKAWTNWCKADNCHVAGKLSFASIQRLFMRSVVESGEVLVRLIFDKFGSSPIPLALEILEGDQLCEDETFVRAPNGNDVRMGVESDKWGRPVAYWIYEYHPGDVYYRSQRPTPIRVPASEIIHGFVCDRPGQTRGIPWLHSGMSRLNNLGGMIEGELIATRAQANVIGFRKTADTEGTYKGYEKSEVGHEYYMEPGMIEVLGPDEDFVGFSPSRPGTGFNPFVQLMLRGFGVGNGISYESVSGDYTNTSYSSARTSMINERDWWQILQQWFTETLLDRLYPIWFDQAVLAGVLPIADYDLRPDFYSCPRWIPRGWAWVDPEKETKSSILGARAGLTSITRELAKQGLDIEEVLEERRREQELAAAMGVELILDISKTSSNDAQEQTNGSGNQSQNADDTETD